ncbi:MAG: cbb3-type cytochrome c oxidase subunit II [Bacteroidota bacterium]
MELFDNYKKLFGTAFLFFAGLTLLVAVIPAINNQQNNAPLPGALPLSGAAEKGKAIFIANGCVACHTQQVRNIDMDRQWGERPGLAADYANIHRTDLWRNTATLMGTERTGPDLTNIGNRQSSRDWNLVHLYNPRIVVKESIMPAYPWLFNTKQEPSAKDIVVNIPAAYSNGNDEKLVASADALYLVAYLQSLKQTKLPEGATAPEFLYPKEIKKAVTGNAPAALDGKAIYTTNCQSCHQANGEGLQGAFPPLKGSPVVTGDNLEKYIGIIMHGYDARAEYGVMPPVGANMNFTEQQIAALVNYERSSWGNNAKPITNEEAKKILDFVKLQAPK